MRKFIHFKPWTAALTAVGLVSATSVLHADENAPAVTTSTNQPPATQTQPTNQPPASTSAPAPLMTALGKAGLADPLGKAGVNVYGYVETGYMRDFSAPNTSDGPTYMGFNNYKNKATLDKISLNFERTVDPTQKKFDVGFRAEGFVGADGKWIHSYGLGDTQTGRNTWDPLQAYVDVAFPDLPMKLRVGKWIELAGFEQFSANIYGAFGDPARATYSYSYSFLYAEPGTQTGAYLTYVFNPQWTVDAGFTRGWNASFNDQNSSLDFLGRVTYTPNDKTAVIFVMTEGPEFPAGVGNGLPPGDNSDYWTALDLVITQKVTDKLSLGLGFDYVETPRIPGVPGNNKQWGAADGYISYAIDPHFTLNTRLEWYNDSANGYPTGALVSANYYEITQGVAIKPFPNNNVLSHLLFRPEIRYDTSDKPVFDNGEHGQLTFNVDALFTF